MDAMGNAADMQAPFTVIMPTEWERVSLLEPDDVVEAHIKRIARRSVGTSLPRDKAPIAIEQARRMLVDSVEDARAYNVHGLTLPVGLMERQIASGLSMFDFEYDTSDSRHVSLGMLRAGTIWSGLGGERFETVDGLQGVRVDDFQEDASAFGGKPGIDAVLSLFAFPVPKRPHRWKALGFSAVLPTGSDESVRELARGVGKAFAQTFRFVGLDDPDAQEYEERLQDVMRRRA